MHEMVQTTDLQYFFSKKIFTALMIGNVKGHYSDVNSDQLLENNLKIQSIDPMLKDLGPSSGSLPTLGLELNTITTELALPFCYLYSVSHEFANICPLSHSPTVLP